VGEDHDKWEIVAKSKEATDWIGVEAEVIVAGLKYEFVDPYWKRSQRGQGLLIDASLEQTLEIFTGLGYKPIKSTVGDQVGV